MNEKYVSNHGKFICIIQKSNLHLNWCRNLFLDNAELYSVQTRNSHNLLLPLTHLTKYKEGVNYAGIWLFNHLTTSIKNTANETKMFKKTLKKLLMDNSFYSVDEFINFRK
jgi:HSP90 family molecular chaperone